MTNETVKIASVIDNSGDNFVGGTDMRKNRSQALNILPVAKDIESRRKSEGWIWMHNVKQSKQVHPDNVNKLKDEGWRTIQSGRKQ